MKKFIATGHFIDLEKEFDTREEAERQIDEWTHEDAEEFGGDPYDYQQDYFVTEY